MSDDSRIFTEKNISSIGGRGKRNSPTTLQLIRDTLAEKADDLSALMEATGFDAKSISSMLNGAGAHIAEAIDAIYTRREKLKAIVEKSFSPTALATRLDKIATSKLGTEIDNLHASLQDELNGSTIIPAGVGAEIVAESGAAKNSERQVER